MRSYDLRVFEHSFMLALVHLDQNCKSDNNKHDGTCTRTYYYDDDDDNNDNNYNYAS